MKAKLKECSHCKQQKPIWKAKSGDMGAFCKDCYIIHQKALESRSDGLKLGKIKMYSLKQWKERKKISPISEKKAKELVEYRRVRDKFLKDSPICMYPGCSSREVECHHSAGKVGKLLTDVRYFKSLCRVHHRIVEEQPDHAKELGLSTTRIDK